MKEFLRRLFKKKQVFVFDPTSPSLPEAFGYTREQFSLLVYELSSLVTITDRLISFDQYVHGPLFDKFRLDLNKPQDAAILGYAFCAAIVTQRNYQTEYAVTKVLEAFYPADGKKQVN